MLSDVEKKTISCIIEPRINYVKKLIEENKGEISEKLAKNIHEMKEKLIERCFVHLFQKNEGNTLPSNEDEDITFEDEDITFEDEDTLLRKKSDIEKFVDTLFKDYQ